MAFSEKLKLKVKKKAHYKCCVCGSFEFLHVHHIVPQEDGGPDTDSNAAPLCTRCHDAYGDNPKKRKWIKEKRDFWYEHCEKKLENEDITHLEIVYEEISEKVNKFMKESRKYKAIQAKGTDLFYTKDLYGEAEIQYGEKSETTCIREMTIVSNVDSLNTYEYFNADSSTKIKCLDGFLVKANRYIKLRDLPSWEGDNKEFPSLYKVTLPIKKIGLGQELRLKYKLKLYGHYKELLSDSNLVSHYFYFRIREETHKAQLVLKIPKGKFSRLCRLQLQSESSKNKIFERLINLKKEKIFEVGKKYGTGWIEESTRNYVLYWTIPTVLSKGTICKIIWYTEPN